MPKILPYSTFGVKNISTLFASSRGGLADFAHVQIFVHNGQSRPRFGPPSSFADEVMPARPCRTIDRSLDWKTADCRKNAAAEKAAAEVHIPRNEELPSKPFLEIADGCSHQQSDHTE